jgi:hypothetical protein
MLCPLIGGVFLASMGLLPPSLASADVGVVGLHPKAAKPGERVDLRLGCGFCSPGARFPISLVPVAQAPRPYPCGENALCTPAAAAPPRRHPFVFLGRASGDRTIGAGRSSVTESHLRFLIPNVKPGLYAFVIFCADCRRGPRGSLITATNDRGELLRVHRRKGPAGSGNETATISHYPVMAETRPQGQTAPL